MLMDENMKQIAEGAPKWANATRHGPGTLDGDAEQHRRLALGITIKECQRRG